MLRIFYKERHVTVYLLLSVLIMCSYLYIAISSDTCLYVNSYRYFVDYPESNGSCWACCLSYAVGGLLHLDTILKLRIAGMLSYLMLWTICYYAFRDYLHRNALGLGLVGATLMICGSPIAHNYNSLSVLLITSGCLLMWKSQKHRWLAPLSGMLMAVSLFARFPNVLQFFVGFVPVASWLFWHRRESIRPSVIRSCGFFIGYLATLAVVVLAMKQGGWWDTYESHVLGIFTTPQVTTSANADHSMSRILELFIYYNTLPLLMAPFFVGAASVLFTMRGRVTGRHWGLRMAYVIMAGAYVYAIYHVSASQYYTIMPLLLPVALLALFNRRLTENPELILLSLIPLEIFPLGSSAVTGFAASVAYWMILPLVMEIVLYRADGLLPDIARVPVKMRTAVSRSLPFLTMLLFVTLMVRVVTFENKCAFLGESRWTSVHTIPGHAYQGIRTTKERAVLLQRMYDGFAGEICEGEPLVTDNIMLLTLFGAKPFGMMMEPKWVSASRYPAMTARAYQEQHVYPLVLTRDPQFLEQIRAGLPDNPQYECVKQVDDYSLYKISQ